MVFLLRVQKDATAASVISEAAAELGLDPGRLYVLAEVKECGGEEWVLEAADQPVQRFLLWPRKAQEKHPQSFGFYFLLQVITRHSVCEVRLEVFVLYEYRISFNLSSVLFCTCLLKLYPTTVPLFFVTSVLYFRRGIMMALSITYTSHL